MYRDTRFLTGDSVYFKRAHKRQWRGPANVLDQYAQQFLIKYGTNYARVHQCNITLTHYPITATKQSEDNTETNNENESSSTLWFPKIIFAGFPST